MKILHTSDWHIDGGTKHGYVDSATGINTRIMDKLRVIDDMIDYAITNGVKIIIHAGDITNNTTPSPTSIKMLSERIKRIVDAGMHFVEVDGNHTMPKTRSKKSVGELLSYIDSGKVHVSFMPELLEIEGVQIATLPWIHQSRLIESGLAEGKTAEEAKAIAETLAFEMFQTLIATADASKPLVTVAHATVSGSAFGAERVVMMGHDIVIPHTLFLDPKICYSALGHIHKHQTVGENHIVYSGTPERVDFGEKDETKGFVVFDAVVGERAKWEFVRTMARPFVEFESSTIDDFEYLYSGIFGGEIIKHKIRGTKSDLQKFDFQKLQKIIESKNPHWYEIVKIVEKEDRETTKETSAELLEELSPIQVLEKWCEKKKVKPAEKAKMLEIAASLLESTDEAKKGEVANGGFLPLYLNLKNHCSHTDTVLDFSTISQAVLSGENGSGKSSLIDSMFWAVWGTSRASSDDDLVRNGYGEMSVEFQFLLGSEKYKVLRTRTVKTTGKGTLDLFGFQNGSWICLSANSMKETQEKIISIVGMSAAVFSASAYLRQGESDMFTSLSPAKRKEIFAELLLLNIWGEIEEKAKGKRREIGGKTVAFEAKNELLLGEIGKKNDFSEKAKALETEVSQNKETLQNAETEVATIEDSVKDFTSVKVRKEAYEQAIFREKEAIEKYNAEKNQIIAQKESFVKIIENKDEILRAKEELEKLEIEIKNHQEQERNYLLRKNEWTQAKAKSEMLEREISTLKSQDFENEETKRMDEVKARFALERSKIQELGKAKKERLESAGTDCPLCSAKKEHQHKNPRAEAEEELAKLRAEYTDSVEREKKELLGISYEFEQKKAARDTAVQAKMAELLSVIIPEEPKLLDQGPDIGKMGECKKKADLVPHLAVAEGRIGEIEARVLFLENETVKSGQIVLDNGKKIAALPEMDASVAGRLEEAKRRVNESKAKVQSSEGMLAITRRDIEKCEEAEKTLEALKKENASVLEELSALDLLVEASGKNGVLALVIDSVLPEIEKESNDILQKISDGKMSVRFSTTREKKSASKKEKETSGAYSETLDIWVEDENGEKEHSMLSGGEKFRVDFAIRIALSKILARRAGTQVRFLLVDEAGTALDEAGKMAFVQAMITISDEFEKILFITHLEDLKDIFSTKIFVEKTGGESKISIF